jgi:hypothetical protein
MTPNKIVYSVIHFVLFLIAIPCIGLLAVSMTAMEILDWILKHVARWTDTPFTETYSNVLDYSEESAQ